MFISYSNFFLNRNNSIKKQKLVGKVTKQLGVEGAGGSDGGDDGSGSKSKQNGLVKVRLRDIHDDWPEDALPNHQMKGGFGSGNAQGTTDATKQIPPVGAKVYGEYENDSQYHPVYHGGSATEDKKNPEFTGDNYGHTYGHADPGGHLQKTNTKEGEEEYLRQHPSGTMHKMDKDGNYNIDAVKSHNVGAESHSIKTDKDHTIDAGGNAVWKIGGTLTIEAKSIAFKHGGATTSTPINLGGGGPSSPSKRTVPTKRNRPTYSKPGLSV